MRYCILDIETSGFNKSTNAICQIAAIVVDENYNIIDTFDMYIKPYDRVYTKKAFEVHGLSEEFLKENGFKLSFVLEQFSLFVIENNINHYVGHNIRLFDKPFLVKALAVQYVNFALLLDRASYYDTMEMSWFKNGVRKSSLKDLCVTYNIKYLGNHNALDDCNSTLELFKILKQ